MHTLFCFYLIIFDQKMRFPESCRVSTPEKLIFAQFVDINFSQHVSFLQGGWLIAVSTFKRKYFNEKVSSLAGLKKSFSISRKSSDFWPFLAN